mgnify:CR=1 FL=1
MQILPVIPGVSPQRFSVALGNAVYLFDLRWNPRDECWFLDAFDEDGTAIFHGAKVVLGSHVGRLHRHRLTADGALIAADTSGRLADAGFEDLGRRVLLVYVPADELVAARTAPGLAVR